MLSKQNVTFVITTRKTFKDPNLQSTEVRLNPLSPAEAKNILVSRIHEHEIQEKLSKTEEIVKLCGCVPLALCIVGSLLSDYTEEKLIKHLEEEPLTVLEDDQTSVENAIKTSFDLLTKAEQEAFVLMSVFPGPFDSDAAEAVMKACSVPGTLPISILRSLKNRSLVEQPSSRKYQLHPLIHAFASKIGRAEHPHLLDEGEKLACVRFMSCLAENANMHWSKDTCKESVESFNEDRHNFEYFLQVYAQGMESKNQAIWSTCKTFLDDFPQKCMYLEKCVLPKFYILILERLLKSFDSEMHPVHAVDVLCLLGHESRKEGDKKKYKELMEKAEQIHSKRSAEFETKALSEVYFRNSYARFLSDKKDPNENKRIEHETETALKVCNDYLGDHPETAATLLFVGIYAKRRKERSEAEQKLTEALELFKKLLGKHVMTAECLKAIADLYRFLGRGETELDKCLAYYGDAMEVFEDLGMGDNKESVLTRKNFGLCHMRKGNFSEAMNLLTKANRVAEQELEEDHKWKVSIKTELAFLHEKRGHPDQAKDVMLEGLLMGKRLDLPIDKMGNKDVVREFIDRYPETFPETEFPRNVQANTVPQADKTRHKGPKHVKPRIDAERPGRARSSSGGMGRVGPAAVAASEPDSRSSENRFSALAEENPEEPRKPVSYFERRRPFRTGEQEKALEAIPAETLPKDIEFGLEPEADSSSQHFARIQDELRTLIRKKKARHKDVLKWIDENVSAEDTKEASFIRALVTVVCEDTMDREESGQCKCRYGRLRDRKKLLQRYIGVNTDLELQALYAVQALFVQLDHPPGFIESYFDSFYDNEIVTKETFNAWESTSEEQRGKGLAVTACSEFFRWIRSAAEEPGED
ncbi:regulation of mRNA cap binding [Desmophyllum pertusum]|uniref:Regulation of mRNA cap binding n=1 Tax=Desmophyllum pertusum TaxID=174260 RepID=A0A9X0CND6_9CNID|nr:regulation of mRNA cap binding [Desmophyllum pertusum]